MERDNSFKKLIADRFKKALSSYDSNAFAQRQVVSELASRIRTFITEGSCVGHVLEIGCGTGLLTKELAGSFKIEEYILNDLFADALELAAKKLRLTNIQKLCQDAETLQLEQGYFDLIASTSTIQWFKNLKLFFSNTASALKNGGILAISTYAPGTMKEFSALTGKGLSYPGIKELEKLLKDDFDILKIDQKEIILPFASPYDVLKHIKYTGVTANDGSHEENYWTPRRLVRFVNDYNERFKLNADGDVSLTYKPIYIIARKKPTE